MLLAIDVGNTNSVFALHDGTKFLGEWRCGTSSARTADEYFVWLRQLMQHHRLETSVIDAVVISNTAPATLFNLRVLCDRYFGTRPLVVGREECRLPIQVRVDPNTRVGPDRLVNTVAAYERYGGEIVVVDFGTATTLDVVAHDGAYIGGAIAPGINLSLDALHSAAAHLPRIDVGMPPQVIGRNTVDCMQSGIYWGYIGLIEGIATRIAAERGHEMRLVATGGLSPLFARGSDMIGIVDPDLTMRGLVIIHDFNKAESKSEAHA